MRLLELCALLTSPVAIPRDITDFGTFLVEMSVVIAPWSRLQSCELLEAHSVHQHEDQHAHQAVVAEDLKEEQR